MLTPHVIDTVKSTIPLLESAGPAITEHFYQRLFSHHPELQDIFNMSHQHSGRQQFALFSAVAAYAKHIDNPQVLTTAIERIAQKHSTFNIQPEQYPIVGHHLIETLRELAPEAFTPDIEEAWRQAYEALASIFIEREAKLYQTNAASAGGWKGTREFVLIEKRLESELVKSLVFAPVDKQPVMDYQPGQYIGIKVKVPGHPHEEIRQYSLSGLSNGETYQISVKREIIGTPGIVSNFLHDELRLGDSVELLAPAGDFFFYDRQKPVALISAGVGLTPMVAILESLASKGYQHPVTYLHACENHEQHSFKKQIEHLTQSLNLNSHVWYNNDHNDEPNYHHGLIDMTTIEQQLPVTEGDFYLCGPVAFMQFAKQQLIRLGVDNGRIHYEVFGPHQDF